METIAQHIPIVRSMLGGRTDIDAKITQWLVNGYRDIAHTIPFETLEFSVNVLTVANIESYMYPAGARGIKAITMGIPPSNPASFVPLYKKNMAIIDRYARQPGQPSIWAPWGNQFYLRAIPNNSYQIVLRCWHWVELLNPVETTGFNVPDDWLEIIDYAAQMRGHIDLAEADKANAIRVLLYGNPKKPEYPGLIKQRLTRIQAEYENANYGLRPRIRRYTQVT